MTLIGLHCWAEAPIKIARMTLTIKLDGNWSSFQLANSTPPLSVTDSAIAPSARMRAFATNPSHSYQVLHQVNAMYGSTCCLQSLATCGCCWASISRWAGALLAQGQSLYQWLLASVYCLFFHCTIVQVLFVTPGCWPSESPTKSPPATPPPPKKM